MNSRINQSSVDACLACAAVCNYCASSCLKEPDVKMMAHCIQLDMECAAVCYATAQLISLGSTRAQAMCLLCEEICLACAAECSKHDNDHCRECARICNQCAITCSEMQYEIQ
jgi:hypothetical protein